MISQKKASSYEAIYLELKDKILHLELTPGSTISETDMAKQYCISRTPIRDAFKALENDGLIEIRSHIGTFVTLIDMDQIADMLYIRSTVETTVISELASHYDPSMDYKIQIALNDQLNLIDREYDQDSFAADFIHSDNAFHGLLFELSGRKNVLGLLNSANTQYERFRTFLNFENRDAVRVLYKQHEALYHALREGTEADIKDLVAHHIYDGFNHNADIVLQYPNYFKTI